MIKSISRVPNAVKTKIKFPEKFKGTIVEKWADYWKNLVIDYRQMFQDIRTDVQDEPVKAMKWVAGLTALTALAINNPNELDFKDTVKRINNEVVLVSEECLNPRATEHLRFLDTCYNQGVIHYKSLGFLSVMYTSELSNSCDLFKAHCTYTQPTYRSYLGKIVDIGIMGRWWNLFIKTTNYDVNI